MRKVFEQKKQTHHIATLKKDSLTFEVLLIPEKAMDYRKGLITDVREALEVEKIFSDARKGDIAPELEKHFGTDNIETIADEIITKGHIQLTTEYKNKLKEQKQREVINIISRNGIDPRNNLPIPVSRIELALEQASFNFDPFKNAEEQVEAVLETLRPILPIRFEEKEIEGIIPAQFAGKANGIVSKYGKILKSEWGGNGSWSFVIRIPGGLQDEFINKLNNITHGEVSIKLR
ncbi:MAG: ribosome assembly factor SBDS [Nanoarchaeota archaeon]|nr:ribosome assembly factor SBDS [Nanoarchaeota archaeon]